MIEMPRLTALKLICLALVLAAAAGLRSWYVMAATENGTLDPALAVQGPGPYPFLPTATELNGHAPPTELDNLAHNLEEHHWFGALPPLARREEQTAHCAPGYPWIAGTLARWGLDARLVLRWGQVALGTLTVLGWFIFARRAFRSTRVAAVAAVLTALHPFWILNVAELADGTLASFLLVACLCLGTRGSQVGGAFTSLLFGLALAALAMVRAALLPFTLIALVWFLWRSRQVRWGWFAGLLAFLGFANGLAPWMVRNVRVYGEPVPIVTSAYLHLWMGTNGRATGGPLDEARLRASFDGERLQELLDEPNQARRYGSLGRDLYEEVMRDPTAALGLRIDAALRFLLGGDWFRYGQLAEQREGDRYAPLPEELDVDIELPLRLSLLVMFVLALLGWRWSCGWSRSARLASLAAVWVPLPYVLGHAEALSGPRLPYDGLLLCYAAYAAVACLRGTKPTPDARVRESDN